MADKNREQWRNPYNRDWDRNESRYSQDQYNQQGYRELGNVNYDRDYKQGRRENDDDYNKGYGGGFQNDYNRRNYGSSEGYSSNRNVGGGRNWGNYNTGNYRENDYGGGYMGSSQNRSDYDRDLNQNRRYDAGYGASGGYGNSYGTYGAFGNMEGDWDRRDYNRGRSDREGKWENTQGTSFGEQGYYGGNYGRSDYGRRDYDRSGYNRGDYDRNQVREDRSWWDKTTDEVSSWFGDDEADRRRERDRQMAGQHKGKGPKGYSRSDDRIREDISDRLSDDDYVDASDIDVQVNGSEVILTGTVDNREAKRRAEDIAERVSGVRNVENRIRVGTERLSVGGSTTNIPSNTGNRSTDI